jgi:cytochrome c-type biogenesis protein CcmH/NrfF
MTKARPVAAIAILALFATASLLIAPLGAQQLSDRAKQVGTKIKCMCRGCEMPASTCSHPGGAFSGMCDTAKMMLGEVDQHIAKGETDEQILQAFVQEYGTQVYTEPPKSGFMIARWRKRSVEETVSAVGTPGISAELLERARAQASRETQD